DKIYWARPTTLNENQRTLIRQSYRGNGLTLERVILDLHSGRLFNASWGIYIMDASAIIMLLLGISGTWVWLLRKRKMKSKRHYRKHHRTA
ncbi:MAG TPA: PepSY-associated TM helix domain-containing protein, partial [Gammaproteobacteria bacterium]